MIPGDNSALRTYDKNFDFYGLVPVLTYTYDANTVTVTDDSTIPAGDTLKNINLEVTDGFGNSVNGNITAAEGNAAIDVSTLDNSRGLFISAMIVTNAGLVAVGTAHKIGASGSIGAWAQNRSAAEALNP